MKPPNAHLTYVPINTETAVTAARKEEKSLQALEFLLPSRIISLPPRLVRIRPNLLLLLNLQPSLNLLPMFPVQILQQNLLIPLLPLIPTNIITPTPHRTRQPARYIRLLADLRDRMEVRADSEDYTAAAREATKRLSLGTEVVV